MAEPNEREAGVQRANSIRQDACEAGGPTLSGGEGPTVSGTIEMSGSGARG